MPHEYSDESSSDDDGVAPTQTTRHRGGGGTSSSNHHRQRSTSSQAESDNDRFEVVVERRVTNGTDGGRYYRESRRRTSAPRDGDDDLDDSETRRRSSIGDSHRIEGGSSSGARTPDSSFLRDLETSSAAASGRIGDSRSIVLALRALQDKIRKLEADRDFHREQCEAARRAHEAYKHEVETRLERDRADFRQREQELQSLIARAKQEHSRLLRTLDDSKADLGSASSEMTTLIERERIDTAAREARLREELDSFRRQIAEERLAKEQLVQQLEQARAERGIVETTNRRLEHTMKDLLSMNEKLVVQQQQRQTQARHVDATADSIQQRSAGVRRSASTDAAAARLRQPPMRFQSPTLSSLQHRSASANPRPDGLEADTSNPRISPPRTRLAPPSVASRPVALHRETRDVYRASYRSTSGVPLARQHAAPHISGESAAAAAQPLDDVYAALEKELRDLNRQYRSVIAEANDPDSHMSHELLTAKLNGIMVQIDRKTEQMRLLRVTKADVTKEDVRTRPHVAKGYVKSTVKANTTNNLRAMAAGSR